jgi:hypothetical protein
MKRLLFAIISIVLLNGCQKETFDISDYWWHGYTYGDNTTMNIRFISDTQFEFEDVGNNGRASYLPGIGKYTRDGNKVTFDFETETVGITRSHMRLVSGEWQIYPTSKFDCYKTQLNVKFIYWSSITNDVNTDEKECEKHMLVGKYE